MALAAKETATPEITLLDGLAESSAAATAAAGALLDKARAAAAAVLSEGGRVSTRAMEHEQHMAHGLAWLATYVESLRQLDAYAARMRQEGRLGELEALIVQTGFASYLAQIAGGIPMSQGETVLPHEMGLDAGDMQAFLDGPVRRLIEEGNTAASRARLAQLIAGREGSSTFGDTGLDETY
ncbi:MAG: hypothetical protein AB7O70_08155 [Hyphomicrobiales bacterium]